MPKANTTQRGYGYPHQLRRKRWQERIDAGEGVRCWRCGRPIGPGDPWHLGHDDDRSRYRGPECPKCNLTDGARKGGRAVAAQRRASQGQAGSFTRSERPPSARRPERGSREW